MENTQVTAEQTMAEFLSCEDFIGGVLVECTRGCGFQSEWGRATILSVDKKNGILLKTDGEAYMSLSETSIVNKMFTVEIKNGVFYLNVPFMWNYILYPASALVGKDSP